MQFEASTASDDQIYVDLDGKQDDEQSGMGIWELQVPGLDKPLKLTIEYGRGPGWGGDWSFVVEDLPEGCKMTKTYPVEEEE